MRSIVLLSVLCFVGCYSDEFDPGAVASPRQADAAPSLPGEADADAAEPSATEDAATVDSSSPTTDAGTPGTDASQPGVDSSVPIADSAPPVDFAPPVDAAPAVDAAGPCVDYVDIPTTPLWTIRASYTLGPNTTQSVPYKCPADGTTGNSCKYAMGNARMYPAKGVCRIQVPAKCLPCTGTVTEW